MVLMKNKIIGITGFKGNIGKILNHELKKYDSKIISFNGDISKKKDTDIWIKKYNFDIIIHLASKSEVDYVLKNKRRSYKVNVTGTYNIVNSINSFATKKIIFFYSSSSHVYSYSNKKVKENSNLKPINEYGKQKRYAENILLKKLSNEHLLIIGRIFNFYNKNSNKSYFINSIKNKIKKNKTIKIKDGYRNFTSVSEIGKSIIKLIKANKKGLYNISCNKKIKLSEIINFLIYNYKKGKLIIESNNLKNSLFADTNKINSFGIYLKPLKLNDILK